MDSQSRSDRADLKSHDKIHAAELDRDHTKLRNNSGYAASVSTSTYASSPFLEDKAVISVAEEKTSFKMFKELLDGRGSPEEAGSGNPIVEKTLYVDTEQKMKSPDLWSSSPKKRDEDHELIIKRNDQTHTEDSSVEDLKKLIAVDTDKKLLPNNHDFRVIEQGSKESFEKHLSKAVTVEKSLYQNHLGLIAPPPLPKSPSDSWLWRTLPSVPTKSSPLRSYHEKQLKTEPDHKKWETIVKATNVKHHHLHYSEVSLCFNIRNRQFYVP